MIHKLCRVLLNKLVNPAVCEDNIFSICFGTKNSGHHLYIEVMKFEQL